MATRAGGGGGGTPGRGKRGGAARATGRRVAKATAVNKRTGALKKGFARNGNTYVKVTGGGRVAARPKKVVARNVQKKTTGRTARRPRKR